MASRLRNMALLHCQYGKGQLEGRKRHDVELGD
jgi:hypothetical protein